MSRFFAKVIYFIGNIYWKVFGGVLFAVVWCIIGLFLSLTIIGFPLAIKSIQTAYMVYKPFGRKGVVIYTGNFFIQLIWSLSFGLIFAAFCLINMFLNSLTLVGIPIAYQWYKLIIHVLFPFSSYYSRRGSCI